MATDAREAQRSLDAPLWLVQRHLRSWESRPEGPAAPFTLKAAAQMTSASRDSNITGGAPVVHLKLYMSYTYGMLADQ